MKLSRFATLAFLSLISVESSTAFAPPSSIRQTVVRTQYSSTLPSASEASTDATGVNSSDDPLGLTAELRRLTDAFQNIGDDKLRYKQLLYMASNGLDDMPEELKVEENKVLGCLSTVHVHATLDKNDLVQFTGDSDGLLTKGLVALLVRGLSGSTADDIQMVDPSFIQTAGIAQSLTPGRNNGFLNMLALMKKKALEATTDTAAEETDESVDDGPVDDSRPMYNGIVSKLQALKPTQLDLVDNSHEHAGHAGNTGNGSESHFQLSIVADAFDGLNLVKRHQLIYMMLGDLMPQIHALQIQAQTPEEAGN
ncbi:SufE-like protein 1, chloroplastic/mitochondrial [Seminavis robusta]|uniref:SufE-like protein 1, chloroplastic/mitochondrial n=1 Tax=Seminavis robusta TaxID=568900 RepID=A0A9N8D5S6_9STRA|nr:SufE-like protein 1, chloroplastic/mitochondrial [Seminavis robusta]|eukprot:Sro12_g009410.1 SufE-like protein 1, chloroplastic/mitochondrial (310) ;mRNA; r:115849-116898